jgi:hypothetical protein
MSPHRILAEADEENPVQTVVGILFDPKSGLNKGSSQKASCHMIVKLYQ